MLLCYTLQLCSEELKCSCIMNYNAFKEIKVLLHYILQAHSIKSKYY